MKPTLEDLNIVITGGTGALGRAVVAQLLEAGARCHVPVFDEGDLADDPNAGHAMVRLHAGIDLTHESAVAEFYDESPNLWGSINLVGGYAGGPLENTSARQFEDLMRLNALTCFSCCKHAVRSMRATERGGRIVNVSARPALVPTAGLVAYAASKAAVAGLTRSLAEELKAENICVNAVAPSIIDTPANRESMPDADFRRWPKPAQIARAIVDLVSPGNAIVSGAIVPVFGRA